MKRLWILSVFILLTAGCRNDGVHSSVSQSGTPQGPNAPAPSSPAVATQGTVDGGGGNTVQDKNTGDRKLLDLAENSDNESFDFDVRAILGDKKIQEGDAFGNILYTPLVRSWAGEDADFFTWALEVAMRTNAETSDANFDKSYDIINAEAFGVPAGKTLHNVQYAFTDKELDAVGDQGLMRVSNPETKRQVAVQDGNGFVLLNKREFNSLDDESKMALKLHESVLYLMLKFNPTLLKKSGTAPMRAFVKNLFGYAYRGTLTKIQTVAPEDLKSSFLVLGLPIVKVDFSPIITAQKQNADSAKLCDFKIATKGYLNAAFYQAHEMVSGLYAMDVDFNIKLALYLTKHQICVVQPQHCEMVVTDRSEYKDKGMYSLKMGDSELDDSGDAQYLMTTILRKYQQAGMCE